MNRSNRCLKSTLWGPPRFNPVDKSKVGNACYFRPLCDSECLPVKRYKNVISLIVSLYISCSPDYIPRKWPWETSRLAAR